MSSPHDAHVEAMRRSLAAYNRGDIEALTEYYSPDIVWHVGGNHPLSGEYRGREELLAYFRTVRELTGGTLTLQPQHILVCDDHISMFTRVTGEREGKSLDVVLSQMFTIGADGRWSEYWAAADDQEALDEFWS